MLRFGCLPLEKVKNQETWLVERKVGLFGMLAFWEDGRLLSKGHLPVSRPVRRFHRYTGRRIKERGQGSSRQVRGLRSLPGVWSV